MPQPEVEVSTNTVKRIVENTAREKWLSRWAVEKTGRALYKEMSKPNPKDTCNKLNRREQCVIFDLRTQHCHLNNHRNRINPENLPNCRHCPHPYETVKHFLVDCPNLAILRQQLLPHQPSISNCLYGSVCEKNLLML